MHLPTIDSHYLPLKKKITVLRLFSEFVAFRKLVFTCPFIKCFSISYEIKESTMSLEETAWRRVRGWNGIQKQGSITHKWLHKSRRRLIIQKKKGGEL